MKFFLIAMIFLGTQIVCADDNKSGSTPNGVTEKTHCKDETVANSKVESEKKSAKKDPNLFGEALTLNQPVTVDEALAQFKTEKAKTLLLEAKVDKVCQTKGCWMTLKSTTSDVRVKFKDYGFFVPISLVGKTVWVQGQMTERKLSLAQTQHYVQDEGGDPSKVTEARTDYQFVASGVLVKN